MCFHHHILWAREYASNLASLIAAGTLLCITTNANICLQAGLVRTTLVFAFIVGLHRGQPLVSGVDLVTGPGLVFASWSIFRYVSAFGALEHLAQVKQACAREGLWSLLLISVQTRQCLVQGLSFQATVPQLSRQVACRYFKTRFICSNEVALDTDRQYIFAHFPHGMVLDQPESGLF